MCSEEYSYLHPTGGGYMMQVSNERDGKITREVLVKKFLERLYQAGDINANTYFSAVTKLEEEEDVN